MIVEGLVRSFKKFPRHRDHNYPPPRDKFSHRIGISEHFHWYLIAVLYLEATAGFPTKLNEFKRTQIDKDPYHVRHVIIVVSTNRIRV